MSLCKLQLQFPVLSWQETGMACSEVFCCCSPSSSRCNVLGKCTSGYKGLFVLLLPSGLSPSFWWSVWTDMYTFSCEVCGCCVKMFLSTFLKSIWISNHLFRLSCLFLHSFMAWTEKADLPRGTPHSPRAFLMLRSPVVSRVLRIFSAVKMQYCEIF